MTELAFPGRAAPVFYTAETDSTNTRLKALAATAADGTVIAAGRQTGGRGRLGRSFASPDGGVYFSMLLAPGMEPERCLTVTPTMAVAVRRAIKNACGAEADIKWPNDLQLGGKKLCGILTEATAAGGGTKLIVGIGINLNTAREDFPPELRDTACSVLSATGRRTPPEALIRELVSSLDETYARWLADPRCAWDEYRAACVTLGRRVRRGEVCGVAADIDGDYALIIKNGESSIRVTSGEILDA